MNHEGNPFSSGDLIEGQELEAKLINDELERERERINANNSLLYQGIRRVGYERKYREKLLGDEFAVFYSIAEFRPISHYTDHEGKLVEDKSVPFNRVTEFVVLLRDCTDKPKDRREGSQLYDVHVGPEIPITNP